MKKSVGKLFCFNIFFASLPNGRQYVDDGDKGNDGVIELQELLRMVVAHHGLWWWLQWNTFRAKAVAIVVRSYSFNIRQFVEINK